LAADLDRNRGSHQTGLRTSAAAYSITSIRQRFAENDISFSVLSDLTDQDLKEIGVSLGHRRPVAA
jgi:hypothetical protein